MYAVSAEKDWRAEDKMMTFNMLDERAELHTWRELPEGLRRDFDYIIEEERDTPRLVHTVRGWLDTHDMIATRPQWQDKGWDGEHVNVFFGAIVVKFLDGDDEGFVKVGEFVS